MGLKLKLWSWKRRMNDTENEDSVPVLHGLLSARTPGKK